MEMKKTEINRLLKLKSAYLYLKKKKFIQDKNAHSLSFFCKEKVKSSIILDKKLLDVMKCISKLDKTDLRINLHSSIKDKHHDMIILQRKNLKYPMHKHISNGETIHIIRGSLAILLFNKKKKLINKIILDAKNKLVFRVPINKYHIIQIKSKIAIYHESLNGPYFRKNTIFA